MRRVSFYEPMFRADVTIVTDCDFPVFLGLITERHPKQPAYSWDEPFDLENGTDGYQFHFNGDNGQGEHFYIWIYETDAYMLAHEIHHLAHDILFTREIRCGRETEEVFAYLTGRLHEMYESAQPCAVEGKKP